MTSLSQTNKLASSAHSCLPAVQFHAHTGPHTWRRQHCSKRINRCKTVPTASAGCASPQRPAGRWGPTCSTGASHCSQQYVMHPWQVRSPYRQQDRRGCRSRVRCRSSGPASDQQPEPELMPAFDSWEDGWGPSAEQLRQQQAEDDSAADIWFEYEVTPCFPFIYLGLAYRGPECAVQRLWLISHGHKSHKNCPNWI